MIVRKVNLVNPSDGDLQGIGSQLRENEVGDG